MEIIELGDIVQLENLPLVVFDQEAPFGFVFDIKGDQIEIIHMSHQKNDGDPFSVKITGQDMHEGSLAQEYFVLTDRVYHISSHSIVHKKGRVSLKKIDEILRQMAHRIAEKYYSTIHMKESDFIPGKTYVRCAGRVYDDGEIKAILDSAFDMWLTSGRFAKQFEDEFAKFLGVKHCLLTNSGSSANLLAISALTSPELGERRLKPGDEVITTACAFPTTVNPIFQNNLIPVFLDIDIGTYNIQADKIEEALSEKTKAIFVAHTLGNPFDLDKVMGIASKYNLWIIEDNCDALGSQYKEQFTGTFGHIATFSFYPAHHITMGEGGALVTNDAKLKRLIESFRDWGRDCWCEPGHDNTCGKRFGWQLGRLPFGYDHKYIYSHIGYNLKITDMQAAIGVAQLKKLPDFIEKRKKNWRLFYEGLKKYEDYFIFPKATKNSEPSWFGFLLTVKENAPFSRNELVDYLEENKIATRMLFAGNIIRHPSFDEMRREGKGYRVVGDLATTDRIMWDTFWVGVYPGMREEMIEFIIEKIREVVRHSHL